MLQAFQKLSLTSSQHYTQLSSSQLPDILRNSPRIRKLDSLLITNFKSFKGKVYVGPLLSFTSIVGPNGAGKSNVLDALMFCFCNQKSKLTYFDIREFIQREGNQTYQEMAERGHSCEVQAKLILEDGKELLVSRTLDAKDQQTYRIDGESYPREAYESFLMRCNINHRTVNYAIWQGEIDKLLLKDPKDLTAYFENLCGSSYFRQEQQEVQEEMTELENKIQSKSGRLVKMRQDKKSLKNLSNFKAAKEKIYEEYESINKKLQLLKAYLSEKGLKDLEKQLQARESEERQQIKTINQRKAKLQREQSQSIELQKKIQTLMKESAEVQHLLKSYEQRNELLETQDAQQLSREIAGLESYLKGLQHRQLDKKKEENSVQSTDISKEYLELYGRWENENTAVNRQLSKRRQEYLYLEGILQAKKNVFQEFHLKKQTQEKALVEDRNHAKEIEKSLAEMDKNIDTLKKEGARLTNEGEKSRQRAEEVAAQLSKTNEEIADLQLLLSDNSQSEKDKELLKKLNTIEGFRGLLREWIKPVHRKYELCFQLMLGPLLKYLLCVNQPAARQASLRLREDMQLRTVVILENVKDKKEQINRTELGKLGTPALQIVEVDKSIVNLEKLLKEFLGGKVLCDNLTAAWTLLGKGVHGIRQIYTLDGDVLRSDGVVSSLGCVESAKNQYRYLNQPGNRNRLLQDIQRLQKTRLQLETERDALKKEYAQTVSKNRGDIIKLESRRDQLKLKQQILLKAIEVRSVAKVPPSLEKEIKDLQARSQSLSDGMRVIQGEMSRSPIFQEFFKAHKISVDSFRNIQDIGSLESAVRQKFKITRELQQLQHEMGKVEGQLKPKMEKLEKIKDRLKDSRGKKEVPQLQNRLQELQTQLEQSKTSLASIKNASTETIRFISEVPQLTARLNLAKDQHNKLLKDQISDSSLREMATNGEYELLQDGPLKGSSEELKKWANELQRQKTSLQSELDQYSMNATDVNQHQTEEQLKNQTDALKTELTALVEQKETLVNRLSAVRKDRNKLLVEFLNELRPVLSQSYYMLTSNGGDVHARVDIHMENPEFPCEAGLYYNPTPPGKRFVYDLDQLSGGQKSIASLALHYSIAVASKSPLLVLDQTDAFLDSTNVSRFLRLVEHCVKERTMQFLVITHKRSLFLQGESLVGVTKPHEDPFSKAYSLFLDEQPE